jgi:hypothetical protein
MRSGRKTTKKSYRENSDSTQKNTKKIHRLVFPARKTPYKLEKMIQKQLDSNAKKEK